MLICCLMFVHGLCSFYIELFHLFWLLSSIISSYFLDTNSLLDKMGDFKYFLPSSGLYISILRSFIEQKFSMLRKFSLSVSLFMDHALRTLYLTLDFEDFPVFFYSDFFFFWGIFLLSQMNVWFYQMLFLHWLIWSCDFLF